MNVNTKLASRVIALRKKKVLPSIINYDRTAYVKNRYIGESIRVIDDILLSCQIRESLWNSVYCTYGKNI